jgi:hypothetical protein
VALGAEDVEPAAANDLLVLGSPFGTDFILERSPLGGIGDLARLLLEAELGVAAE